MDEDSPQNNPVGYCRSLASDLRTVTPEPVGFYVHGSACLGGWSETNSDVDTILVVEDGIFRQSLKTIVGVLIERADDCPGRGLECSIVTRSAARSIRDRWPFLAHFNSGEEGIRTVFPDSADRSDPDLLMHYVVCRVAGITISGPPPAETFGPVDRALVLGYLADELEWGLAHSGSAYALLNGCRALEYLERDRIVSKIDGGLAALDREKAPVAEIRRAIRVQEGIEPAGQIAAIGEAFVRGVADRLRREAMTR